MEKTNEILTIAGVRVGVEYSDDRNDCCGRCVFFANTCTADGGHLNIPCEEYDKDGKYAYFVRAEEIEGTPQEVTLIPSNDDDDKAAEEACAKCPISGRCFVEDKGRKDACDYLRGFKAGIAYERERLMKEAVEAELWRHNGRTLKVNAVLPANSPIKLGDKVKLIILK